VAGSLIALPIGRSTLRKLMTECHGSCSLMRMSRDRRAHNGQCRMCCNVRLLVEGHIVPSFVYRWLKETSATGFLRTGENPNIRKQDGWKRYWFCRECEDQMGRFEKPFSNQLFPLLTTDQPGPYRYGPWLSRFAATVAWRTVLLYMERADAFELFTTEQKALLPSALEHWRAFARGEAETPGMHELHFIPMGLIKSFRGPTTPQPNLRYAMRAIEIHVASTTTQAFAYVKMGPAVVLGFIQPPTPNNWVGTCISLRNDQLARQMSVPAPFVEYFMERAARVLASERQLSPRQRDKINRAIEAHIERAADSETTRAMEADVRMFGMGQVFLQDKNPGEPAS
jgi:hypothetical protein